MAESTQSKRGWGALLSRYFLAKMAGLSFGTARDAYKVFGYERRLDPQKLRERVQRQDIVKTCLYKPAEAIWTNPPSIEGDQAFVTAWNNFVKAHGLWAALLRADKMLGVEPYVALFLGVPGDPAAPVSRVDGGQVAFMQPYGMSVAEIADYDRNPQSKRFGRPTGYSLSVQNGSSPMKFTTHWSRCVHLTNELTDDNVQSVPRILPAYNLFDDIIKITGGAAETFWLTANRGMQVDVDKEMELDEGEANALSDELDEFQHQLRRYVRTRGVKIRNLGSDVADPRGTFDVLISLLAGTYGIPQRVLLGSEAGQLASEQDRANWAETVQARRISMAEPYVLRPLIQRLQEMGILPETQDYRFVWPDAFHMSPLERAQTMAQTARAVGNLSRQAQYGTPVTTNEEARMICGLPGTASTDHTYPEMPEKQGTTTPKKDKAAGSEATATKVTGTDENSDGVSDDKNGATKATTATAT